MSDASRARGDSAELKGGIVRLAPQLRRFARSLTGRPDSADDLVQETILKALVNIEMFRVGSNLRAWLFTILRNTFYSDRRKHHREVQDCEGEHSERLADRPRQDGVVDLEDFKRLFRRLPVHHREALTLIGISGCSYEEAALICDCPVGTIKSRLNRARERLGAMSEGVAAASKHPARKEFARKELANA